jgi:hypothetical protein
MDDAEKESIGKMVGAGVGLTGGAKVGSLLIPIPIVGPFVGGVLGAFLGSEVGQRSGRALINGAEAFVATLRDELPKPPTPGGGLPPLEPGPPS